MRKLKFCLAVQALFLLLPASIIRGQNISSEKGLTTAIFTVPSGTIKVYLPDDIRQSDIISGTVTAKAEGKNEKQLQKNQDELAKYSIRLNGEIFIVDKPAKLFQFTVQSDKPLQGLIELMHVGTSTPDQQLAIPSKPLSEQKSAPAQCTIPGHVLTGSPMTITGPFDGNAANTQCTIGNQPATILAESPRSSIIAFPANAKGMQPTQIQENGQQLCSKTISGVDMNVSAGKLNLTKGENTFIDVSITGLQNLQGTALLLLHNLTTDIVAMQPSNNIVVPLVPDSVSSGNFNRRFNVQSIRTGGFSVNVNLDFQDIMMSPKPEDPKKGDQAPPTVSKQKPEDYEYLVIGDNKFKRPVDSIPDKKQKSCSRSTAEDILPKMDGGLKLGTFGTGENQVNIPDKQTIKRDGFIQRVAEGADFDSYIIQCSPTDLCVEGYTVKVVPIAGRVRFQWEIIGGPGKGHFVKLGCLYSSDSDDQKTEGEQVIFMPPVLQLPVYPGKETIVTTKVKLSIIDDKESLKDTQVDREFEIITKRYPDNPDEYKIEIKYNHQHTLPGPVSKDAKNNCEAIAGAWDKKDDLIVPEIILPDVPENKKMVLGQWIVLEAKDQHETDILPGIVCGTSCSDILPFSKSFEDKLNWTWTITQGKGKFVAGRFGRYIIYQAPTVLPEGKTEIEVKIKVTVSNQGSIQAMDQEKESEEISIMVYQPGIKMHYPSKEWLPENNNSVTVTSELQCKINGKWKPSLPHMCRILYFELVNVSQERGITMNDPIYNDADNCADLQFMNSEVEGNAEVYASVDFTKKQLSKCTLKDQYMMTRTVKPLQKFTVDVYSLDFGSYGFIRSFANTNNIEKLDLTPPFYQSIPWLKPEVSHPSTTNTIPRLKPIEYTDNRVTIPVDIDENHIPDQGWKSVKENLVTTIADPLKNSADEDDLPVGNKTKGDGLTTYEEYRGFSELVGKNKVHTRTDPAKKDIFIYNRDNLDISLFKTVTGLDVHEVVVENILSENYRKDARVINFNVNNGSPMHIVNQRGLRLVDAGNHSGLLGIACPTSDCPVEGGVGPPNWMYEIRIFTIAIARVCSLKTLDPKEKLRQVIAHELCHGINVCHHGEGNPNIEGDYEKINGLRSGDINCIMRYDNSGKGILGKNEKDINKPETIGSHLCISPAGTGYNQLGHRPGFDNAAAGRGNCQNQMQITGFGNKPQPCKQ